MSNELANKTLVLDLDETLIHQTTGGEIVVPISLPNGNSVEVCLNC